jgi:hypothetical protein
MVLTMLLGSGGVGGLVILARFRTDRESTVVQTVSHGLLAQERIIASLEKHNDRLQAERDAALARLARYEPAADR